MTQILRHSAEKMRIPIGADGYCRVQDILAAWPLRNLRATLADVERAVEDSDKRRFELKLEGGERFIRAAQGHSMSIVQDDLLLRRLTLEDADLPEVCECGVP